MSLKKLDQAFLELEKTSEKILATNEFDIKLMEQFNENFKDVTNALNDYKKPSLLGLFHFNGKLGRKER